MVESLKVGAHVDLCFGVGLPRGGARIRSGEGERDGVLAEGPLGAHRAGAEERWLTVVDPQVHRVKCRTPDGRLGGRPGDAQLRHRATACVVRSALKSSRPGERADPAPIEDLAEIAGYSPRGC